MWPWWAWALLLLARCCCATARSSLHQRCRPSSPPALLAISPCATSERMASPLIWKSTIASSASLSINCATFPRVIGVAGGESKIPIIRAALHARLLHVLVTDQTAAAKLLKEGVDD